MLEDFQYKSLLLSFNQKGYTSEWVRRVGGVWVNDKQVQMGALL